jgi:hypothetical protein
MGKIIVDNLAYARVVKEMGRLILFSSRASLTYRLPHQRRQHFI